MEHTTNKLLKELVEDEDKLAILRELIDNAYHDKTTKPKLSPDMVRDILEERMNAYFKEYSFKIGDCVKWKEGLKNKTIPEYGQPCIVMDIVNPPLFDKESSSGSPYFNEELDIKVGIVDEDDDFMIFYLDSKRLEYFE